MPTDPSRSAASGAVSRVPKGLSREALVEEAVRQIDEHGLEALSMRRLAGALDVAAPTLYWHIRNRDELLDLVADHLFSKLTQPPDLAEDWRAAVRVQLHGIWRLAEEHRAFLEVLGERPLHSPAGNKVLEHLLTILRNAGFAPRDAVLHARTFLWLAFGLIRGTDSSRRRMELHPETTVELEPTDPAREELLAPCLPYLQVIEPGDVFTDAIELVLQGMADPSPTRGRRHAGDRQSR